MLFTERIANELLKQLFAGVPNADPLIDAARGGVAAAVRTATRVMRIDEAQLVELFAQLFAWPGGAPAARLALRADPTSRVEALAQHVAKIIGPLFAQAFAGDSTAEAAKPGPPDSVLSAENLNAELTKLAQDQNFAPIKKALDESGLIELAIQTLGGGGAAAAVYSPEVVERALRALVQALGRVLPGLAPQLLRSLALYVELELRQSALRSGIAEAVGRALDALPFSVQSKADIGVYVHGVLQDRYRARHRSRRLVIERWNKVARRAELVVHLPAFSIEPVSLRAVAGSRRFDPDYFFAALRAAMAGFHIYKRNSWLRADLVDADLEQIWEIKPTSSLFGGVWQETLYRVTHNVVRAVMLGNMPVGLRRAGFLFPGEFWSIGGELVEEGRTRGLLPLETISVGALAGAPAIAFPFQLGVLPGIIGYFVLRGPNIPEMQRVLEIAMVAAMAAALRSMLRILDEVQAGWEEAVRVARQVYEALAKVIARIAEAVKTLLLVLACIVVLVGLGVLVIKLGVIAAGGAVVGGLAAAGAALLLFVVTPSKDGDTGTSAAVGERLDPLTDIRLGPIQIQGISTAKAPAVLAAIATRYHELAGVFVGEYAAGQSARA